LATYTTCPVRQNFFKCSNKFSKVACPAADTVAQTSEQSNFTADTKNLELQLTCTAAAANANAATAVSAYRWTQGVCDSTGYYVSTFLDSECKYNDTNTNITGLIEPGTTCSEVPVSSGSVSEWV